MAEASAGLPGWRAFADGGGRGAGRGWASLQPGCWLSALNRAQRFTDAVDVLDRAASALDDGHADAFAPLEAAAVVAGLNDPATASSMAPRRRALRTVPSAMTAPADVLAAARRSSLSSATSRRRSVPAWRCERSWRRNATKRAFGQSGVVLARDVRAGGALAGLNRPVRTAAAADRRADRIARLTGDGGQFALGLASRGLLALRRGDLSAAEADGRTALSASELPAPPTYLVPERGGLLEAFIEQGG